MELSKWTRASIDRTRETTLPPHAMATPGNAFAIAVICAMLIVLMRRRRNMIDDDHPRRV